MNTLLTCVLRVCQLEVWGIWMIVFCKTLFYGMTSSCCMSFQLKKGWEGNWVPRYFWIIQGNKGCILRFALCLHWYLVFKSHMSLKILKKVLWFLNVKLKYNPESSFVFAKKKLDKLLNLQSSESHYFWRWYANIRFISISKGHAILRRICILYTKISSNQVGAAVCDIRRIT